MTHASSQIGFETGSATHVGKVRTGNEDSLLARPEIGLWVVADGMGGHEGGELASGALVEAMAAVAPPQSAAAFFQDCESHIASANQAIRTLARERNLDVIGTTVVALLAYDGHFACLWAGDSRIYRVRGGFLEQLTRDHTEVQELISKGILRPDEAKTWPRRNVITRAIGVEDDPELELQHGPIEPGDTYVLCSDGLTGHVADEEICDAVRQKPPQEACDALIELTLERGASDNVTVIVVRYRPEREITLVQPGASARWD